MSTHWFRGEYAFWKGPADAKLVEVDVRETIVDVGGHEIMTADKVTLRLNAVVTYKVVVARKSVSQTDDVRQALYRDTQLVLRGVIGAREIDVFLTDKDAVAKEIEENVRRRAGELVSMGAQTIPAERTAGRFSAFCNGATCGKDFSTKFPQLMSVCTWMN